MRRFFLPLFLLLLTACSPSTSVSSDVEQQVVSVYADAFAERWLPALYDCAGQTPAVLVLRTLEIDSANIILRVTPVPDARGESYQLGELEFAVVTHAANPLSVLTWVDLQGIYTGKLSDWSELGGAAAPIQVWAYAPETGLNGIFLGGGRLSSLAQQAQGPAAMRAGVVSDPSTLGFIPLDDALAAEGIQIIDISQRLTFPILASISAQEPEFISLVACLQGRIQ